MAHGPQRLVLQLLIVWLGQQHRHLPDLLFEEPAVKLLPRGRLLDLLNEPLHHIRVCSRRWHYLRRLWPETNPPVRHVCACARFAVLELQSRILPDLSQSERAVGNRSVSPLLRGDERGLYSFLPEKGARTGHCCQRIVDRWRCITVGYLLSRSHAL